MIKRNHLCEGTGGNKKIRMRLILTMIIGLSLQIAQAQTSDDYFNEEVKDGQRNTCRQAIEKLENKNLEAIEELFSSELKKLNTDLRSIADSIEKVKDQTKYSEVIVFVDGFNIFRCRYYNEQGSLFQVDFYFTAGQKDSKIVRIETKDAKTLAIERERRMKSSKTPPPPPPPPGY